MKQTFNFLLMLVMVATVFSCKKKDPEPLPVAEFTFTPNTGRSPITVTFTNNSLNADTYAWDFGGGAPASTEKNPVVNFTTGGTFVITLTATGAGGTTKVTKNITLLRPFTPAENIIGKYRLTTLTSTLNGVVTNLILIRDACRLDDTYEFAIDGKFITDEKTTICSPPPTYPISNYVLSANGKTLTFNNSNTSGGIYTEIYAVEELTTIVLKTSTTLNGGELINVTFTKI